MGVSHGLFVTTTFQLKLKNMVTTQQEKLLGEKEVVMERQKHELQGIKDDLAKKQEEVILFIMASHYVQSDHKVSYHT